MARDLHSKENTHLISARAVFLDGLDAEREVTEFWDCACSKNIVKRTAFNLRTGSANGQQSR